MLHDLVYWVSLWESVFHARGTKIEVQARVCQPLRSNRANQRCAVAMNMVWGGCFYTRLAILIALMVLTGRQAGFMWQLHRLSAQISECVMLPPIDPAPIKRSPAPSAAKLPAVCTWLAVVCGELQIAGSEMSCGILLR